MEKKYHIIYKTTCLVNNKYYIGVHSTDRLNDGYLGSGTAFIGALKKYGRENFKRDILAMYDTKKQALIAERELVNINEIKNKDCYNIAIGGKGPSYRRVTVVDKSGNFMSVGIDDERYISGELSSIQKGKVIVKDNNNKLVVSKDDPRYINGELVALTRGTVMVRGKDGKCFRVDKNDPRYVSGELKGSTYNMVCVYDINDITKKGFSVDKDHPKYISGEYVAKSKGRRCKESVKLLKKLQNKHKVWISKGKKSIMIHIDDFTKYRGDGWERGRTQIKKN